MSKHTPGPWKINGDRLGAIDVADSAGTMVAAVYLRSPSNDEDANARLIAAAPDLLDACKTALSNLSRSLDAIRVLNEMVGYGEGGTESTNEYAQERCQAAIKKATGA